MTNHPQSPSGRTHRVALAGAGLLLAVKQLKVAFPKKKQEATATIVLEGRPGELEFRLAGAAVWVPAALESAFVCQVPWTIFKDTLLAKPKPEEIVRLEFGSGWFSSNSMRVKSDQISVTSGDSLDAGIMPANLDQLASTEGPKLTVADPTASPVGFPMVAAYDYVRRFGLQTSISNRAFVKQQQEVLAIVSRVAELLAPLDVSRDEIEKLLDSKRIATPLAFPEATS